jgi:hypothetical protein
VRVSTGDLDEQRPSMVLKLYCRKAGRKGEVGKREREERLERKRVRVRGREERREARSSLGGILTFQMAASFALHQSVSNLHVNLARH